jgi:hypothetical protein
MYQEVFDRFVASNDTLWVYEGSKLIFSSDRDRLLPLMEYLGNYAANHRDVVILDKIIGNAAALLAIEAGCSEVLSPLGSELAAKTLEHYGVTYHFTRTVACIQRADGEAMCPMEQLSLGKKPEEFYRIMLDKIGKSPVQE